MNLIKYKKMEKELKRLQQENQFIRDNYCSKNEIVRIYAIFRTAITEALGEAEMQKVLETIKNFPYEYCLEQYPKETGVLSSRLNINKPTGVIHEQDIAKAVRQVTEKG